MKEIISTITSKGQVTVPVEVRRQLGLKKGDKVAFILDNEGEAKLRIPQYPSVASLRGAAGTLPRPMSWDEIEQTVAGDRAEALLAKNGKPAQ